MARRFLLLLCLVALGADAPEKGPAGRTDAARTRFLALVRDAAQFLEKTPAYSVQVVNTYKAETADKGPVEGLSLCRLLWQRPGHFRLECTAAGKSAPQLISVSDGKSLTTLLVPQKLYSRKTVAQPVEELRRNALVMQSLEGSGLDVLLRPDLADYVGTIVSRVQLVGVEPLAGGQAEHFRVRWGDRDAELWIAADGPPVLRQFTRTLITPVQGRKFRMVTTAQLTWKFGETFPADTFTVVLPEGARKVGDLYEALIEAGTSPLLGRSAADLDLKHLDGRPVRLAEHKGKDVVVLLFWAAWAAPSTDELAALGKLVTEYQGKGVAFYTVNVGQKESEVKAFVEKHPVPGTVVVDPRSESVDGYGVAALPTVVLLGKDGTVQACHRGPRPGVRESLQKELNALLKGVALVPAAPRK